MKKYQNVTEEDYLFFCNIVSQNNCFYKEQVAKDYTHDELTTIVASPEIHLKPRTKEEVSLIVSYANTKKIPITIRGAGTGLVGGCVPIVGGILLDLSAMNKILELDKENMTLRVEPGVLLLDIYECVEKHGLFYAPDPGEKTATIGGNIATNAGGMRAVKYGVTRDWVRGLEVVLASGEILKLGAKVVKNSSGFALKDLIIGAEGTLAVVVEATLRLIPKPQNTVSLLVPFQNKEEAISAALKIMLDEVIPTGLEFFESDSLKNSEDFLGKKIPNGNFAAYLLLTYDGSNQRALEEEIALISDHCVHKYQALDVFLVDTEERKKNIWTVRGGFLEAIKAGTTAMDECDVVLPRARISEFLSFTKKVSEKVALRIPYFGHIGDGNLHIYLCKDQLSDDLFEAQKQEGFKLLYDEAFRLGGLVSGEHGIGYAKRAYLLDLVGKTQIKLMKDIKLAFDPNEIFNPEKVI